LLAEEGCSAVCADLKIELVYKTFEMIKVDGKGDVVAIAADLMKAEECSKIVDLAMEKLGRLDILVNNKEVSSTLEALPLSKRSSVYLLPYI
jgi:NAD(P)-dependent dehydrogenase (short-subunit alcohol dehydrogenase family)